MNIIPIYFSSSNEYVPFLCVALESLIKNSSPENTYRITIMEKNISEEHKEILLKNYSNKNVIIEFFNMEKLNYDFSLYTFGHVSVETYYKLCIPVIAKDYSKCIFLDSDILVLSDVANLYKEDIKDYALGVTRCCLISGLYNYDLKLQRYIQNKLKIRDVSHYFQGGVLLLNTQMWNNISATKQLMRNVSSNNYIYVDQCALNEFFQDNVKFLNQKWNYETVQKGFRTTYKLTDENILNIHRKAKKSPYIIHYSGAYKPWFYPDEEYANIWWKYARQTPFYEEILQRMIDFRISQIKPQSNNAEIQQIRKEFAQVHFPNINNRFDTNEYNTKLLFVLEHSIHFKLKKFWYAIKKAFAFGKRYQKYNQKYQNVKKLLKDARKFRKTMFHI